MARAINYTCRTSRVVPEYGKIECGPQSTTTAEVTVIENTDSAVFCLHGVCSACNRLFTKPLQKAQAQKLISNDAEHIQIGSSPDSNSRDIHGSASLRSMTPEELVAGWEFLQQVTDCRQAEIDPN